MDALLKSFCYARLQCISTLAFLMTRMKMLDFFLFHSVVKVQVRTYRRMF